MEEQWKVIKDYPNYEVSNFGDVRRIGNTQPLARHKAKGETWFVRLSVDGVAMSKVLKWLVAEAFVPHEEGLDPNIFDTPIQLVLDTREVRADKIVWRPRWFAIQFRKQLNPNTMPWYHDVPVMNLDTGNQHASILTAALHDGALMKQINRSCDEGMRTSPHGYRYEFMWRIWENQPSAHYPWVVYRTKNR